MTAPRRELDTASRSEIQIKRWNVGLGKTLAIHSKLWRSTPPTLPRSSATTGISSNIAQKIRNGAKARSRPSRLIDRADIVRWGPQRWSRDVPAVRKAAGTWIPQEEEDVRLRPRWSNRWQAARSRRPPPSS